MLRFAYDLLIPFLFLVPKRNMFMIEKFSNFFYKNIFFSINRHVKYYKNFLYDFSLFNYSFVWEYLILDLKKVVKIFPLTFKFLIKNYSNFGDPMSLVDIG
jgi:hypothetical protein